MLEQSFYLTFQLINEKKSKRNMCNKTTCAFQISLVLFNLQNVRLPLRKWFYLYGSDKVLTNFKLLCLGIKGLGLGFFFFRTSFEVINEGFDGSFVIKFYLRADVVVWDSFSGKVWQLADDFLKFATLQSMLYNLRWQLERKQIKGLTRNLRRP